MPEDDLRYDRMVEEALRSVVGKALAHVAEHGLPGSHHFYITFRTDHPDVAMPDHLRRRYPSEMTIVLQYQFDDLDVGPDGFAVTLFFSGVAERLTIPYVAVVAFADPAVRFGLQFDVGEGDRGAVEGLPGPGETERAEAGALTAGADAGVEPPLELPLEPAADKVVTLDTFRKK
ncbi:MAG: SspB family protein [Kiloniellaceae bacterium]